MHGRKRRGKDAPAVPQAELDKKATKVRLYTKLSHAVIALRRATAPEAPATGAPATEAPATEARATEAATLRPTSQSISQSILPPMAPMVRNALKATAKMAAVNPDFYSLWNLRRDLLARANDLGARRLVWDGQRLTISTRGSLTIREVKG